MSKRLYLLDFDRTLFDTTKFQEVIGRILSPEDPQAFHRDIPKYSDERTGYYSVMKQAQTMTGLSRDQTLALFAKHIPDEEYCYTDVPRWIKDHKKPGVALAIITVGGPDYQGLKFEHAPCLNGIPKHLIKDSKSGLLAAELKGQSLPYHVSYVPGSFDEIYLVDDRRDHLDGLGHLPGVTPVHLARPGGKYSTDPASNETMHEIKDFGELA